MRKLLLLITCLAACGGGAKSAPGSGDVTATRGLGGGSTGGAPPGGAAPSCDAAAEHVAAIADISKRPLTADQRRMGAVAFRERCTEDKWSVDIQKCLLAASSRREVSACRQQLPPDQNAALGKDLRERLGRTHTGDQPKAVNMSADPCEGGE